MFFQVSCYATTLDFVPFLKNSKRIWELFLKQLWTHYTKTFLSGSQKQFDGTNQSIK